MTADKTGAETTVRDNPEENRYDILVQTPGGETLAGFAEYRDRVSGTQDAPLTARVFFHTEVDPDFGGRGLATILVTEALDDARARDLTIVGVCPLVAAYLKKHPEYADATAPVTPAVLEWLRTGNA
ncbi:putative acetyltransferase [Gordonia terrae C-6]|uniref:Putative acetyltransferase n=1 Tax=Gordonia terrae C-6 TaxID=1316928 RepID=R7YB16_9ACTN|nr:MULTISPECIES: GNAT family N-acetyltransferase [Gordonia]EON33177.1 putative acetyltransferase [Gordonia terrae C-6]